jgi:hypothetical protein
MNTPHFVCLGDVIALEVESTPLLGPMQTDLNDSDGKDRTVTFLKVVELTAHINWQAHRNDVRFVAPPHPGIRAVTCVAIFGLDRSALTVLRTLLGPSHLLASGMCRRIRMHRTRTTSAMCRRPSMR